ncbi:MAG: zf-HC2 domain-containing protein [Acidobacteria bacterium]|nr:zf-HC2 domain-containing protein [Acidobacteriota bacterium]
MTQCDRFRDQISFYLDEELGEPERAQLADHLGQCESCHKVFEQEQQFLAHIRACQPLYRVSSNFRAKIEQTISEVSAPHRAPASLRDRIQKSMDVHNSSPTSSFWNWKPLAVVASILVMVLIGIWVLGLLPINRLMPTPSEFARMAVDTHVRRLRGQLPLEITTASPDQISAWFAGKVAFQLKLPNYQESSGQTRLYQLEGARLVGFKNDYAAFVAYEMQHRPITLVVTANSVVMPSGGEEIKSKGITFHCDSINGLKVISWADRGLTYALVSDLEERGQDSCFVCHTGTKDRDFIENLKLAK